MWNRQSGISGHLREEPETWSPKWFLCSEESGGGPAEELMASFRTQTGHTPPPHLAGSLWVCLPCRLPTDVYTSCDVAWNVSWGCFKSLTGTHVSCLPAGCTTSCGPSPSPPPQPHAEQPTGCGEPVASTPEEPPGVHAPQRSSGLTTPPPARHYDYHC